MQPEGHGHWATTPMQPRSNNAANKQFRMFPEPFRLSAVVVGDGLFRGELGGRGAGELGDEDTGVLGDWSHGQPGGLDGKPHQMETTKTEKTQRATRFLAKRR